MTTGRPAPVALREPAPTGDAAGGGGRPDSAGRPAPQRPRGAGRRTNFGVAFALLPRAQRDAIRAVHAWSRAVDDTVDEEADPRRARQHLEAWRDDLAALFASDGDARAPETLRLAPHVRRFGIPRRYFEELIEGVGMDLSHTRYRDFAELQRYCYRVASVVGLICLRIFGDAEERARDYAESLGLALQLTNILRDVGTDAARGRIYLPADERDRFGVEEASILRGERTDALLALLGHQASRARGYFDAARAEMRTLERRRYVAAEIMGRVYERLLDRIEASGFDVFAGEIRVPRFERAWIAASTAAAIRLGR
jgi:phytoene synthase